MSPTSPQSAVRSPQSAVRSPQSAVRNPQSAVRTKVIVALSRTALLALLVTGCSDPVTVADQGRVLELGNATEQTVLPLGARMKAIAARQKIERMGTLRTESVRRTYDSMGRVVEETVFRNGKFERRPSTLRADLAIRPLTSFLPANTEIDKPVFGRASLVEETLRTFERTASWNGASVSLSDSNTTNSSALIDEFTRDASIVDHDMNTMVWYPNTSVLDSVTRSSGADIMLVEEGTIVGYELFGEIWEAGMAQFSADTAALAALKAPEGEGVFLSQTPAESTDAVLGVDGKPLTDADLLALAKAQGPCDSEARDYWISVAVFGVAGIVAIKSCDNPVGWIFSCGRALGLVDGAFAAVNATGAVYALCRQQNSGFAADLQPVGVTYLGE